MKTRIENRRSYRFWFVVAVFPFLFNGYVNSKISTWPVIYWSFELLTWVVIPVFAFVMARKECGLNAIALGFSSMIRGKRNLPLLFLLCGILPWVDFAVYKTSYNFFSQYLPSQGLFQYSNVVPSSGLVRFFVAAYFALSAGLIEEPLYRGAAALLFLHAKYPAVGFILVSPIIFAVVHWESGMANVAASYIVGLFTAHVFALTRNVWPLVVAHAYTDYVWFG